LLADTTRELRDVGFWEEHQDRFREGAEPEPPYVGEPLTPGLLVPERGFGKLWRDDGRLRHKLNFASGVELGFRGAAQQFERGRMLLTGTGEPQAPTVWVLSSGGGYRRFPLP
jgi:hypothetical protein